jgi:uncharacterized protein YndB with AHSA1/START domain
MTKRTVVHDTFVIVRTYPKPMAQVFAYLSDPAKKCRWLAASDVGTAKSFEMDFREGGVERNRYRMNEHARLPGAVLVNEGFYQDIVPDRRIVMATNMTMAGRRISCSLITFELLEADLGTEVVLTHQGTFFEGADEPEMRKEGWAQLLDRLGQSMAN